MEDQSVEEQHASPIIFQPTNIQSQRITIIVSIPADTNKTSIILSLAQVVNFPEIEYFWKF